MKTGTKKRMGAALLGLALSAPGMAHPTSVLQTSATCRVRSAEMLQALQKHDYTVATAHFDAAMKAGLSPARLGQLWARGLPGQWGALGRAGEAETQTSNGWVIVDTPLHFARAWRTMRVTCDADGQVGGLFFLPWRWPLAAGVSERRLAVPSPLGPLPGTLTLPEGKGPFPAVLLVAGSGPNDRDETIGPNKPLLDIAMGLAKAGIASLRYDKRTHVYAAQMVGKAITVDDEVTDDALAALRLLAKQPMIDPHRLFVLGHSLGGMMAPRIGRRDPQLAGLILLAAPARPLLAVIAEQVREQGGRHHWPAARIAAAERAIAVERKLLADADPRHPPQGSFGGAPQSYWLSLHDYHPVAVAETLSMPMLILQGGSDFQVSPRNDFARWEKALGGRLGVSFHLYPGLSHLFMPAGKTLTTADYRVPGHVDARVIHDVAAWIEAQPPRR